MGYLRPMACPGLSCRRDGLDAMVDGLHQIAELSAGRPFEKPAGPPPARDRFAVPRQPLRSGMARVGCSTWRGTLAVDSLLIQRRAIIDSISDCSRRNNGGTDGTGRCSWEGVCRKELNPAGSFVVMIRLPATN